MRRNVRNWNYRDVTRFLQENGFEFAHPLKGSHQAWVKLNNEGDPIIVEVSRPKTSYKIKTLADMIRQSEIPQEEWFKWAQS